MERIIAISTSYQCRPSVVAGIEIDWIAYDFDSACMLYQKYRKDGKIPESEKRETDPLQNILRMAGR